MDNEWQTERFTDGELKDFFDQFFPNGFAGADVIAEIAPDGWDKSPLLACFHPSAEQVFQGALQMHRNIEDLMRVRREREPDNPKLARRREPTFEEIRAQREDKPVKAIDLESAGCRQAPSASANPAASRLQVGETAD